MCAAPSLRLLLHQLDWGFCNVEDRDQKDRVKKIVCVIMTSQISKAALLLPSS